MQRLEVSDAVRSLKGSLGFKGLKWFGNGRSHDSTLLSIILFVTEVPWRHYKYKVQHRVGINIYLCWHARYRKRYTIDAYQTTVFLCNRKCYIQLIYNVHIFYVVCTFKMFVFTVELIYASFSHVPIIQIENIDVLIQGTPNEFRESCVPYCTVYTTRLLVL